MSTERGMVTELEMRNATHAAGGQYILRYHKTDKGTDAVLEMSSPDAASWTGFRYHDTQWSFVRFAAKPGTVIGFS